MGLAVSPQDVGLPPKFDAWRVGQDDAIENIIGAFGDGFRFVAISAPVGCGKTVQYIAVALLMGWRVCVVTSSKGLQDQLLKDFGGIGLFDIRGRGNYECLLGAGVDCSEGANARCHHQFPSRTGVGGEGGRLGQLPDMAPLPPSHVSCPYRQALAEARRSRLVVTNYPYAMLTEMYGDGLGEFDLLVLDEAHDAEQQVCSVMRVEFTARRVYRMLGARFPEGRTGEPPTLATWKEWAKELLPSAVRSEQQVKEGAGRGTVDRTTARELASWGALVKDLQTVLGATGAWASEAIQTKDGSGWALEPLWAKEYAHLLLFRDVPRVLLVSATMRPKTLELLGLKAEEVDFQDYPYVFPIRRSPVYFLPTAWVKGDMSGETMGILAGMVDAIIDGRLDRRGLIHTVSYHLRDELKGQCRNGHVMLKHERNSNSVRETVEWFRTDSPPVVLPSPSIGTGWDFPYEDAEYQIIPKLPFPSVKSSAIMSARCNKKQGGDPEYSNYLMVQSLSQMLGRPMRAADDRAETFILDCNFFWVQKDLKKMFPSWVNRLIQRVRVLPKAPPPLSIERAQREGAA